MKHHPLLIIIISFSMSLELCVSVYKIQIRVYNLVIFYLSIR